MAGLAGGTMGLALARLVSPPAALIFAAVIFAAGSLSGLWCNPPVRHLHPADSEAVVVALVVARCRGVHVAADCVHLVAPAVG